MLSPSSSSRLAQQTYMNAITHEHAQDVQTQRCYTWTHKTSNKWPTQSGAQQSQTKRISHTVTTNQPPVTTNNPNQTCTVVTTTKKVTHTVVSYHNKLLESTNFNAARTHTCDQSRIESQTHNIITTRVAHYHTNKVIAFTWLIVW